MLFSYSTRSAAIAYLWGGVILSDSTHKEKECHSGDSLIGSLILSGKLLAKLILSLVIVAAGSIARL